MSLTDAPSHSHFRQPDDTQPRSYHGAQTEIEDYRKEFGNGQPTAADISKFTSTMHEHGFPDLRVGDGSTPDQSKKLEETVQSIEHALKGHENDSGAISKANDALGQLQKADAGDSGLFNHEVHMINKMLVDDNLPQFKYDANTHSWSIESPKSSSSPSDSSPSTSPTSSPPEGQVNGPMQPAGSPAGSDGGSGGAPSAGGGSPEVASPGGGGSTGGGATQSDSSAAAASDSGGSVGPLTSAVGEAPQNAQAMYQFFVQHGLSPNAAAGIIGNIAQESGGNPESVGSGGNGLIGWTPPLAGAVTGNPQRDLQFQLNAVMDYIKQNGSVADINANASSPSAAAAYFMNKYERPYAPTENADHRESAANAVAQMFGSSGSSSTANA